MEGEVEETKQEKQQKWRNKSNKYFDSLKRTGSFARELEYIGSYIFCDKDSTVLNNAANNVMIFECGVLRKNVRLRTFNEKSHDHESNCAFNHTWVGEMFFAWKSNMICKIIIK